MTFAIFARSLEVLCLFTAFSFGNKPFTNAALNKNMSTTENSTSHPDEWTMDGSDQDSHTTVLLETTESASQMKTGGGGGGGGTVTDWDLVAEVTEFYNYYTSVVPYTALIFNSLSMFVFASKGKKELTVNMLLTGLSLSDTLSLGTSLDYAIYFWSDYKYSLQQKTDIGCRGVQYITNIARDCSSYFILTFTIDRFVAVWFPLKRSSIMTKKRVKIAMVLTVLISAIAEVYMPILLTYNKAVGNCYSADDQLMGTVSSAIRNVIGFILPGVLVAILNAFIVQRLQKYQEKRNTMTKSSGGTSKEAANRSLTIMLVTVSTFSFVVYIPKVAFFFVMTFKLTEVNTAYYIAAYLTDALAMLNYSCNFFFYCLSGSQFRQDLKNAFLRLVGRKVNDRTYSTSGNSVRTRPSSGAWNTQDQTKLALPNDDSETEFNQSSLKKGITNPAMTTSNDTLNSSLPSLADDNVQLDPGVV